jgi:hypothetical protein
MSLVSKSKGSLSGLEFRVLSREIDSALAGSYVSNIYSVGESQLLRMRRPGGQVGGEPSEVSLVLSPKLGAWITEKPARVETTDFTTALRSNLLRAKLQSVSQVDLDRVLILQFEGKGEDGSLKLVLELMPPGNLVLTGPGFARDPHSGRPDKGPGEGEDARPRPWEGALHPQKVCRRVPRPPFAQPGGLGRHPR